MHRHLPLRCHAIVLVLLAALSPGLLAQGIITTAAGTDWVFNGDGKPALAAPLGKVAYVTVDPAGNPVFADPGSAVVVRVNPNGSATVLAGNGIQAFSGDGGPAVSAALSSPQGVAYDSKGNLFIVDTGNERIRMVTKDGTITTVAGNGRPGYSGDGSSAVNATLNYPLALAIDSANNIYISDVQNSAIRKVTPDGIISTFVGPATRASLNNVEGMAFDSAGNLYIAEFDTNLIRQIDPKGVITTFAGDGQGRFFGDKGQAAKASFFSPGGIAVDAARNIYVADTNNFCIRIINPQGIVSTIAGNRTQGFSGDGGPAINATFRAVFGLAVDSAGNLFIADRDNFRIRKVSATKTISTVAGNGEFRKFADGVPPANAFLFQPLGISSDAAGNIYIADTSNERIRMIGRSGAISTIAGNGGSEYSGDGGLATKAGLFSPTSTTPDRLGNLYIADSDNEVIRKIRPDGTIITVAGTGDRGYNGENRQAPSALLDTPQQVVLDGAGNLYISECGVCRANPLDPGSNRIRKVTPDGIITTFAGGNQVGFFGEGVPASQALLNGPIGLAFDPAGNLYVADWLNARIRRISADGKITTFAGGGTRTPASTDSFPATQAQLGRPLGIAVDGFNNVYFSDGRTNRVLKVSTSGLITVVAGNGIAAFSGDGGPSTQAALSFPYGLAVDPAGNLWIADALNNRIRTVLVAPPTLQSSPASLSFSVKSGGGLSDAQPVAISGSVPGLVYSLTANTASGGAWLKADQSGGTAPAVAQIVVDPTGLKAGDYQGAIVVSAANASPPSRTIAVNLTVVAPADAKLGIATQALTFTLVQGAGKTSQNLTVSNLGGGSLAFSASATSDSPANFLNVSPGSAAATPVKPASVAVQADPGTLDPGTYTGSISIASDTAGTARIPVTMTVSRVPRRLLLSQAGLKFTAVAQGGAPLPQNFAVLNGGRGDVNWTVQADTVPAGGKWLIVPTAGGASTGGASNFPVVTVAVDAASLDRGEYYGKIQIFSPDADNSPQTVTVFLDVLAAGSDPGPGVQPAGLVFTGNSGASPGSQNVFISNLTGKPIAYSSGRSTEDGQNWFVNAPTNATVLPDQPARIVVQPDFTGLGPGTYNGTLQLTFPGGVTRTVNILSIVGGPGNPLSSSDLPAAGGLRPLLTPQAGCSPTRLNVQFTSPEKNFTRTVSQPVTVQVAVVDDCNTPLSSSIGQVTARFSNGDPDLKLNPKGGGLWENSWQPNTATSQVRMVVVAFEELSLGKPIGGQTPEPPLSGTMRPGGLTPQVNSGVMNSASFVARPLVAPGGLITIFGQQLVDTCDSLPGPPFASQLGGTQVFLDNSPLAILYACDTQINAQVPYTLAVNTSHQILVQRTAALSVPVDLSVAATQPAVFTVNQQGTGQGDIFRIVPDGSLPTADASNPAKIGDTVAIYCTGLGTVAPTVDLGAPAPAVPVAQTTSPVLVTIGGKQAAVLSAALTPNYAGVYTINVVVPAGVTPGDQVEVVLTAGGQTSPPVTMAVR